MFKATWHHDELSEEIQALIAIAPNDVTISRLSPGHYKVEHVDDRGATHTRWMSPWNHNVREWAFAVAQVREK